MSATILPFTRKPVPQPPQARVRAVAGVAEHFGRRWTASHLPLILAALDMLGADEADFAERCRLIATEPGAMVRLVDQLAALAGHLSDVAEALAMTVQRIRSVTLKSQGRPA